MLSGSYEEKLLKSSFAVLEKNFDGVVEVFYDEFFKRYPEHEKLFSQSQAAVQKKHMVKALINLVKFAGEPTKLSMALTHVGKRHGELGVKATYYNQMIEVMLDVLGKFCGSTWNEEVRRVWHKVLLDGAKAMIIAYR